ncbi:substrate-binding domain-containing protein [Pseudomonas palmensis]|uniref:substrate-binding domain-containing protein n=1 Tax=Pseudomonas palmensis TaxID=2815362 RepID=UPI003CF7CF6F
MRGPQRSSAAQERLRAFQECLDAYGVKCDPALIVQGDYSLDGGYLAAKQFFAMENPPTAIIAANDMSALGVINAAAEGGAPFPMRSRWLGCWMRLTHRTRKSAAAGCSAREWQN